MVCYALPPERFGRVTLGDWWCGFGSGLTMKEARRKAVGEIVERASAVFQGEEPRRRATLRSLGDHAVAPETFLLFSRRQRRLQGRNRSPLFRIPPRLPADQPIDWTPMRSLTHGCWKQVPTSAVYFKVPASPANRYCPAGSNGLAAGRSLGEATLRALLELIERDSVALWWYQRVARPRLAVGQDARVQRLLAGYERQGRTTELLDLTSDLGIPVCAAVSRRTGDGGDVAFGFGAGLTRPVAARRALLELGQPLATRAAGWAPGEGTGPFERWRRVQRDPLPAWLLARARRTPKRASPRAAPAARAALTRCRRAVERAGLEVLVADLTRRRTGLAVARVIVPGLRHLWPRFAPGRLYEAPEAADWITRTARESRLNPVPLLV